MCWGSTHPASSSRPGARFTPEIEAEGFTRVTNEIEPGPAACAG